MLETECLEYQFRLEFSELTECWTHLEKGSTGKKFKCFQELLHNWEIQEQTTDFLCTAVEISGTYLENKKETMSSPLGSERSLGDLLSYIF